MIESAFITGFFGDLGLQILVNNSENQNKFGLKTYFKQHGQIESLFLAGGLMAGSFLVYKALDPKYDLWGMCIYASILDMIFRMTHIFPSLDGYYKTEPPYWTIPWAVIPVIISFYVNTMINKFIEV